MSAERLNIVCRYGDDDISLWTVDIDFEDFKRVASDAERVEGSFKSVINALPTVNENGDAVHFIFLDEEENNLDPDVIVLSGKADESFFNRYEMRGFSVRGPVQDVIYEFTTMHDPLITVSMTVNEAYELSNVADLEIVNCEDAHRKRILEVATAKLEKAIGQVPVPDCEMEEEESDDLEV